MAIAGFLKEFDFIALLMKIIKAMVCCWHAATGIFYNSCHDQKEEERIDALAQRIIQTSSLLNDRKFIPYGPAYTKLPGSKELP